MRPVRAGSFVTLLGDVKERAACAVDGVVASGVPREWTAGASARREHERRKSRREHAVRDKHPRIGALLLSHSGSRPRTSAVGHTARPVRKFG
jgi:hypothetical protein